MTALENLHHNIFKTLRTYLAMSPKDGSEVMEFLECSVEELQNLARDREEAFTSERMMELVANAFKNIINRLESKEENEPDPD